MTALAVDGNNLIAINCHAHPQLTSGVGEPTGGLYGTVKRLRALLLHELDDEIGDIVLVMDSTRPSFRYELHPGYKDTEQRKNKDDELYQCYRQQCDAIARLVVPLGVAVVEAPEYEADDGLAGIVFHSLPKKLNWIVLSGDKDLLQLSRHPRCRVYRPTAHQMHKTVARGYLLARVLIGDPSDNIPGVPGIGEQRAWDIVHSGKNSPIGKNFANPRELFAHYDGKYRAKLDEHRDVVRRFWRVMNLKLTAAGAYGCLRVQRSKPDRRAFARVCRQLDFDSIMADFIPFFNTFAEAWKHRQWRIPSSTLSKVG